MADPLLWNWFQTRDLRDWFDLLFWSQRVKSFWQPILSIWCLKAKPLWTYPTCPPLKKYRISWSSEDGCNSASQPGACSYHVKNGVEGKPEGDNWCNVELLLLMLCYNVYLNNEYFSNNLCDQGSYQRKSCLTVQCDCFLRIMKHVAQSGNTWKRGLEVWQCFTHCILPLMQETVGLSCPRQTDLPESYCLTHSEIKIWSLWQSQSGSAAVAAIL